MDNPHHCASCQAPLQPEDGHDLCPTCLGPEHLREALSDNPCMNCSYMPWAMRAARLAEFEPPEGEGDLPSSGQLPPPQLRRSKRRAEAAAAAAPSRKKVRSDHSRLSSKVDQLSAELAQMRSLFMARHSDTSLEGAGAPSEKEEGEADAPLEDSDMPVLVPEDDALSLAASATYFGEYAEDTEDGASQASEPSSHSSAQSSLAETEDSSMRATMRMALDRLGLDVPQQAESAHASALFRRRPAPSAFAVPHSADYLNVLHAAWRDSKACSRLQADGRALAAMHDAARVGLGHMPAIEPAIASLIVSPDEALRQNARCPSPQCRVTDDLLTRAYDAGARAGRIGNSLSHIMLALSASLQANSVDVVPRSLSDASLYAFGLITRELGRMMSILVQTRRQVWLAQANLTEASRRTLRSLPVEPGELFGSAALEALERTIQAGHTRQQLLGLRRRMPPPSRAPSNRSGGPSIAPRARLPPPAHSSDRRGPQRPVQRLTRDFRGSARLPSRQPQAPDPVRPPRAPRGRGARN